MIYAYIRVSHSESVLSGLSVAAQERAIRQYCELHGLSDWAPTRYPEIESPGFFVDLAVSAYKKHIKQRPAGGLLCNLLKPGDTIVMYKIDRGFRSTEDFCRTVSNWVANQIDVRIVTQSINLTSANGRFLATILAAYAQWQSDMKSERGKAGVAFGRKNTGPRDQRKNVIAASHILPTVEPTDPVLESGTVYSYARISHESRLHGASEDFQKAQCDRLADYLCRTHPGLVRGEHFFDAAVSAFKTPFTRRAEAKRLCSLLKAGDRIVFTRLDRAWRSIHDLCDTWRLWENAGVNIHFCDTDLDSSTALGRMMLRMFGVLAQWESEDQSERTKEALSRATAEGRWVKNQPPTGMYKLPIGNDKCILAFDWNSAPKFIWSYWVTKQPIRRMDIVPTLERASAACEKRRPIPEWGRDDGKGHTYRPVMSIAAIDRHVRDFHIIWHAARNTDRPIGSAFIALKEGIDAGTHHPSCLFANPRTIARNEWKRITREFGPGGQRRLDSPLIVDECSGLLPLRADDDTRAAT